MVNHQSPVPLFFVLLPNNRETQSLAQNGSPISPRSSHSGQRTPGQELRSLGASSHLLSASSLAISSIVEEKSCCKFTESFVESDLSFSSGNLLYKFSPAFYL
eukprot:TRINITY_DN9962_c0_g1_i2.p2 TRINITY_DN9962_c0_g1~~TRINITY_DN9962_c0_g1_i2.p2  ORF type:complete len:103 (-),score=4.85 TRINITY_DN9962_c0_g1_i2:93-401(-)